MNKGSYATNLRKIVMPNGHEYFVDPYLKILKNTMYADDKKSYDDLSPEELDFINKQGLQAQPNANTNQVDELKRFIKTEIRKCLEEKLNGSD